MHSASRPRASHHSHHSSLSHFDDIKELQAELAKQSHSDSLAAPPRNIGSAQSSPQPPKQALATINSRPHSSARLLPATWNPAFLDKPAAYKRYLILHPAVHPVCTLHLAAITIQRWWRRLGRLRRTKRSRRRVEHLPTWEHPWRRLAQQINAQLQQSALVEVQAEVVGDGGDSGGGSVVRAGSSSRPTDLMRAAVSLDDHCASIIQRAWRASRERRHGRYLRRPMYRTAAVSIQQWWRGRRVALGLKRLARIAAAVCIQRAYRRFCDRKTYRFFRQLLLSRQNANPLLLLRTLGAREQTLADASSGLYVRLRLGGVTFPPLIYYKVFTMQHVLDIGSFAPRHYAADDKRRRDAKKSGEAQQAATTDVALWYQRWENNGWRVVGGQLLLEHREDAVENDTAAVRSYHHPNRQVRRGEAERRRKERRVEWMKHMYALGRQGETNTERVEEAKEDLTVTDLYQLTHAMDAMIGATMAERARLEAEASAAAEARVWNSADEEEEEDADSLVDWASQLCFDEYQQHWAKQGASKPAHRDKALR